MKNEIATMADLKERIKELEEIEAIQIMSIKSQAREISADLKPLALVKSAFHEITGSGNLKRNVLDTSVGVGAGLLARKLLTFNSTNIFRKLTGYALQFITTKLVTNKMPVIREKITHHNHT